MKIAVIGSGYAGLVAASCLSEIGHDAICADADIQKIRQGRKSHGPAAN